jgi:hypothetical protein
MPERLHETPVSLFTSEEGVLSLFILILSTVLLCFNQIDGQAWGTALGIATGGFSIGRGVRKHGKP